MPPQKRKLTAVKAEGRKVKKNKKEEPTSNSGGETQGGPAAEINASYNQALASSWERIQAHPEFADMKDKPLPMSDQQIRKELKDKGFVRFEGNVFVGAVHGFDHAPASKTKTDGWKTKHYSKTNGTLPESMNHTFKFAVLAGGDLQQLQLLSPPEARDALVFRIDEAIEDGESDDTLKLWKNAALTAPVCLVSCEASEIKWKQITERNEVGRSFNLLFRTAIGTMFEVLDMVITHEQTTRSEMTAEEVATRWNEKVDYTGIGDRVTPTYANALMKIRRRIIGNKDAIVKLLAADETFGVAGTPWDSIYKLEALATKVGARENKSNERLIFLIDYIADRIKSDNIDSADLSVRAMSGKSKAGNKGILDLGLMKFDMIEHGLGVLLEDYGGDAKMKDTIRDVFGDFAEFRESFGYPTDNTIKSNPWMSLINHSLQKFSDIFREAIYEVQHDNCIMNLLRAGRSGREVWEEGVLAEKLNKLKEEMVADAGKGKDKPAAPSNLPSGSQQHTFSLALNITDATKTPDAKMSMRLKAMTTEERDDLLYYEKLALTKIADHTEWVTEQLTVKQMAEVIRNTEYGKTRGVAGEQGQYIMISYQPKIAAEAATQPHLRQPPLRNQRTAPGGPHYQKMVQAMVSAREPADSVTAGHSLHDGDVYVVGDGGKHGNSLAILSVFSKPSGGSVEKVNKTLMVHYSEEDVRSRQCYVHVLSDDCPLRITCRALFRTSD